MPNKLTISAGLKWSDGRDTVGDAVSFQQDQIGDNVIYNIQNVGTVAELITLGDVAPGFILFKNLEAANGNFVILGNDNAVATVVAKLLPGQGVMLPTSNSTWYAKADTAGIRLLVMAVDL